MFVEEFNANAGKAVKAVPQTVWRPLASYHWPGHVRELRNVVERCMLLAEGTVFPERWLHLTETSPVAAPPTANANSLCVPMDGSMSLDAMEQRIISKALARNESNVSLTARVFGTTREKLRYWIQKYGLKAID